MHEAAQAVQCAAAVAQLREQLEARYGWTHIEIAFEPLGAARVRALGTIAVPSLAATIRAHLAAQIGPELELELELRPMPVLAWHRLPALPETTPETTPKSSLELWAEHPQRGQRRSLATELDHRDGPVGLLAEVGSARLLRARDGTVGWSEAELGPLAPAPTLPEPILPATDPGVAVCEAANAYLGVPYLLGGTSTRRIDCSGLVARAYLEALGIVVPRNSNDQLAITGGDAIERPHGDAGDLLFMRSRALGRTHVGIATGAGTVIHASRSRNAVLVEPVAEFETDAEWLRRVPWPAIVAWSRTHVGRPHLEPSELPARTSVTPRPPCGVRVPMVSTLLLALATTSLLAAAPPELPAEAPAEPAVPADAAEAPIQVQPEPAAPVQPEPAAAPVEAAPVPVAVEAAPPKPPKPPKKPKPSPEERLAKVDEARIEMHLGIRGYGRFLDAEPAYGGSVQLGAGVRLVRGLYLSGELGAGVHGMPLGAGAQVLVGLRHELRVSKWVRPTFSLGYTHLVDLGFDAGFQADCDCFDWNDHHPHPQPGPNGNNVDIDGHGDVDLIQRNGIQGGLGLRFPMRWAPRLSVYVQLDGAYYFDREPGRLQIGGGGGLQVVF